MDIGSGSASQFGPARANLELESLVMMRSTGRRSRVAYGLAVVVVILVGLASRKYPSVLPAFAAAYAGDTLWALMVFLLAGIIWPLAPTRRLAASAALFALAIEISQLNHAPWIERLRATRPGGLILGYDFVWSDLLCYAAGVAAGAGFEQLLQRRRTSNMNGAPQPAPESG
jgi:hypothetical protein